MQCNVAGIVNMNLFFCEKVKNILINCAGFSQESVQSSSEEENFMRCDPV